MTGLIMVLKFFSKSSMLSATTNLEKSNRITMYLFCSPVGWLPMYVPPKSESNRPASLMS